MNKNEPFRLLDVLRPISQTGWYMWKSTKKPTNGFANVVKRRRRQRSGRDLSSRHENVFPRLFPPRPATWKHESGCKKGFGRERFFQKNFIACEVVFLITHCGPPPVGIHECKQWHWHTLFQKVCIRKRPEGDTCWMFGETWNGIHEWYHERDRFFFVGI